jgi:hypothetical protein
MTDFPLETVGNNKTSLIGRELELFSSIPQEIGEGIKNRGQQMMDNKLLTTVEIVGAAAIGAGIAIASKNPGSIAGQIARYAPRVMGYAAAADMAVRIGEPMVEAGRDGGSLALAKKQLGANLGSAVIDYPLMAASGLAGMKLAPKVSGLLAPELVGSRAPLAFEAGPAGPAGGGTRAPQDFQRILRSEINPRGLGEQAPKMADIIPGSGRLDPNLFKTITMKDVLVTQRDFPPAPVTAAMGVAAVHNFFMPTPISKPESLLEKLPKLGEQWLKKSEGHLREFQGESIRRLDDADRYLKVAPDWFKKHSDEFGEKVERATKK